MKHLSNSLLKISGWGTREKLHWEMLCSDDLMIIVESLGSFSHEIRAGKENPACQHRDDYKPWLGHSSQRNHQTQYDVPYCTWPS